MNKAVGRSLVEHLPGKHDQTSHGKGGAIGGMGGAGNRKKTTKYQPQEITTPLFLRRKVRLTRTTVPKVLRSL